MANRVTYICGAAHFKQSVSTLKSGDKVLTEIFPKFQEGQEKFIHVNLSDVSRQRAE
jgi:hypothetical protein